MGIQLGIWEGSGRVGDRDLAITTVWNLEEHEISWLRESMVDRRASGPSHGLP